MKTWPCKILFCHVADAAKLRFMSTSAPTGADFIGRHLGISLSTQGSLTKLLAHLLAARATCARVAQQLMCRGLLECDGASLRRWRRKGASSLIYLQIFGVLERNMEATSQALEKDSRGDA